MKKCFKCGAEKPLSEFYVHPQMGDGHLGKCKTCTCSDAMAHRKAKLKDVEWIKSERARCREKSRLYRGAGLANPTSQAVKDAYRRRHPERSRAQVSANRAVKRGLIEKQSTCSVCKCDVKRLHKHHPDYTKPTTVIWVCPKCHGEIHWKIREQQLTTTIKP